jgi:hypothetical protein
MGKVARICSGDIGAKLMINILFLKHARIYHQFLFNLFWDNLYLIYSAGSGQQLHRLSINRTTKRGKENSRSDGHCQCEKEMEDHWLACQ